MSVSRKRFLQALAGGAVVLLYEGCGGDDSGGAASAVVANCSHSAITGNHGHGVTFARTDLDSTSDKVYDIMNTATHNHTITLTPAMLATLKAGTAVTVTTSVGNGHTHDVTVSCP